MKVGAGILAWGAILVVTTAYHLGYADFRSNKIVQPNIGSTIMSVPTLVTANPVASPISHVFLHIAAVIHPPRTELFLPPHREKVALPGPTEEERDVLEALYRKPKTPTPMNITLQGTNLDLTEALRTYVDKKMRDAFRAFGDMDLEPVEVAVELEVTTHHHRKGERLYRAEANVSMPGRMLRAEATADDMYKAITQLKHTLMRDIRRWRERLIDETRQGARRATTMPEEARPEEVAEEAWDLWEDEEPSDEEAEDDRWEDWEEPGEDERD